MSEETEEDRYQPPTEEEKAMLERRQGPKVRPLAFALMIPRITQHAREFGYAIAAHGSLQRDLDLVAIPWSDTAEDPETLVREIAIVAGGFILDTDTPAPKPHVRVARIIHLGGGLYIDLSIMPRLSVDDAARIPQPDYGDVFEAYMAGAQAALKHPDVTEAVIRKSADAHCKLLRAGKDPEGFAAMGKD